jgi:hypothetical protein
MDMLKVKTLYSVYGVPKNNVYSCEPPIDLRAPLCLSAITKSDLCGFSETQNEWHTYSSGDRTHSSRQQFPANPAMCVRD